MIAGYDDVVFLIVPDKSEFSRCMPLVIGTCMLGRIVNVIKESELAQTSTSWVMMQASHLCWHGTAALEVGDAGSAPADEGGTTSMASPDQEIDEPIFMKESLKQGPFQTQIIECKTKPLLGESTHVMITPLRACEAQPDGVQPLLSGLHVLHAYTWLKMSSSKMSVIVRNMSDSPIFLRKGVRVARMVSASPVPPMELSPEMEAALGAETVCEPMTVAVLQEKLLEKLNLASVIGPQETWWLQESSSWPSMTSLHWMEMSLDVQVQLSTKSTSTIVSPLKSGSGTLLCHFWMVDVLCSETCWMWGQYIPASLHGAMPWHWFRKRMELCTSVWISAGLRHVPRRTCTCCHGYRKHWRVRWAPCTFQQWTLRADFGKLGCCQSPNSIPPPWWEIWDSTSLLACSVGYAMPP